FNDLLRWVSRQIFAWRQEMKFLFVSSLANQEFKKMGAFEPPVAETCGIERNEYNRIDPCISDFTDLTPAFLEKMKGLRLGDTSCSDWIVQLLLIIGPGDTVIFYAGKFPGAAANWSQVFQWQIESRVAIKFTVSRVARITSLCAPN